MRAFRWLAAGPIGAAHDLRRLGWRLVEADKDAAAPSSPECPVLVRPAGLPPDLWRSLAAAGPGARRWVLLVDIPAASTRARLLRLGFGDALAGPVVLAELAARAQRVADHAGSLPRERWIGPVRLDLLAREAFVAGRGVGLHPREFALLWRLADQPGAAVGPRELLADVWRLAFRPETNSLAVHVSRLRAKLRLAGAGEPIETLASGAYRLVGHELPLDAPGPLRNHCREEREP